MQNRFDTSLFIFRRDLRLLDNRGLAEATRQSRKVIAVFVFDTNILDDLRQRNDRRVTFIHDSVTELREQFRQRDSELVVLHGDPAERIPALAERVGADAVFVNRDYEPYAVLRDDGIRSSLAECGRSFHSFKDQVIFEGEEIQTQTGTAYKVFTPYKRAWLRRFAEMQLVGPSPDAEELYDETALASGSMLATLSDPWTLKALGFARNESWTGGGAASGRKRLEEFLPHLSSYKEHRDFPSRDGTSGLSVHLRFGTISIRECVRAARSDDSQGAQTWLSELIWREFYQMLLDRFPYVVNHAFKREYDAIEWPGSHEHLEAWKDGRTGYPIVDAAMRELRSTGWMHNRLRMITAMFLVKDLLIDWRHGERHFAEYLLDYDLASNNGGWQWAASTGADGVPYFRVFNPELQSRRFDPDGGYIRSQIPELANFSNKLIHRPHAATALEQEMAGCTMGRDYPHPVIQHAEQKERAIALFKKLRKG